MKSLTKTYHIKAPIKDVWDCLTSDKLMDKWGARPSSFDPEVGGEFNMWGDYVVGKILKMEKNKYLEEDWTVDGMDQPSKVVFELAESGDITTITLSHSNIPADLEEDINVGWDEFYLGAIKDYLE